MSEIFLDFTPLKLIPRELTLRAVDELCARLSVCIGKGASFSESSSFPLEMRVSLVRDILTCRIATPPLGRLEPDTMNDDDRLRFFEISLDLLSTARISTGQFMMINSAWKTVLGYPLTELIARPFVDFVHPDDREETIKASQALGDGNAVVNFKNRYRHAFAIIDITGIVTVDTHAANTLLRIAQAVRLLGAEVVLTGIHARTAQTLVSLGVSLDGLITRSTLQEAIAWALQSNTTSIRHSADAADRNRRTSR